MKFKETLSILLLIFAFYSSKAQYGSCNTTKLELENFKSSKTLVVLTGNKEFDENLKLGMNTYWKLTDYDFIEESEVKSKLSNKKYSFIMPLENQITDNVSTQSYPILALLLGGRTDGYNMIAHNEIDNFGKEKSVIDASYRAKHLIKILHDYMLLKLDGKVRSYCASMRSGLQNIYNEKNHLIKQKTLLIDEAQTKLNETDAKKYYSGKVKITSKKEIEKIINKGDKDYCYLLPVFTRHKFIYVVDVETGSIIYDYYSAYGVTLKKSDIKKVFKAAK